MPENKIEYSLNIEIKKMKPFKMHKNKELD